MDVPKLLKALDDETNENLLDFTTKKLREMTLNILKELHLSKNNTLEIFTKLKDYKYVDEMSDLKYGTYIRWIPLEDPTDIYLTKGALFCEMRITDNGLCSGTMTGGISCSCNFQITNAGQVKVKAF